MNVCIPTLAPYHRWLLPCLLGMSVAAPLCAGDLDELYAQSLHETRQVSLSRALSEDLWLGFRLSSPLPAIAESLTPAPHGERLDAAQDVIPTRELHVGMGYALTPHTRLDWQHRLALPPRALFPSSAVLADSPMRSSWALTHQAGERWSLTGQYAWDHQNLHGEHLALGPLRPGEVSQWSLSVGSEYRFDPRWTLQGGLRYSQQQETLSDQTTVALGAAFRGTSRLSLEMAYTHALIHHQSLALNADAPSLSDDGHTLPPVDAQRFGLGLRYDF